MARNDRTSTELHSCERTSGSASEGRRNAQFADPVTEPIGHWRTLAGAITWNNSRRIRIKLTRLSKSAPKRETEENDAYVGRLRALRALAFAYTAPCPIPSSSGLMSLFCVPFQLTETLLRAVLFYMVSRCQTRASIAQTLANDLLPNDSKR